MTTNAEADDDVPAWAQRVVAARVWLLVALGLFTAVMAWSATRLAFDFSPENLFVSDDPDLAFFEEKLVPAFSDAGRTCVLAIEADLESEQAQAALVAAVRAFERIDGLGAVTSLLTVELPTDAALGYAKLFDDKGRATGAALAKAAKDPNLGGLIIAKDLNMTAVLAPLVLDAVDDEQPQATQKRQEATVARVIAASKVLANDHPSVRFHLAGVPVSHAFIVKTLKDDQVRFIPLVIAVMALLLFVSFRDLRSVVLPFVATGCAALWCVGAMAAAGHAINVVNNAIVVLLLVVGIADGVHLVERFGAELARERARRGRPDVDKDRVIAKTIAAMTLPCALTTATTAVGFLGALVAKMPLVRAFGVDAALGVLGAFVATMVVVPALLGVLPLPSPRAEWKTPAPLVLIDRLLAWATAFALRSPKLLVVGFSLSAVGLAVLASQVHADQTLLSELPDTSPSKKSLKLLEEHLAGVLPVEVVYVADTPAPLIAPATIRHMAAIKADLERGDVGREVLAAKNLAPIAPKVRALGDVYASVAQAVGGVIAAKPPAEWTDEDIRQLQLLFELAPAKNQRAATAGLLAPAHKMARVVALLPDAGTQRFLPFLEALKERVKPFPPGVVVRVSGGQVVASAAMESVSADMMASVGLAFILIFVFVTLLFRSVVVGALALIPNAFPVLATLAAMGALKMPLRLATVLTFCMALGVAVDACIHLLARLREESAHEPSLAVAIERTMHGANSASGRLSGAGRPVFISTALLLGGFVVLGLSEFGGLRDFAILAAATLTCALVVDLLLLPALVLLVRPKFHSRASRSPVDDGE